MHSEPILVPRKEAARLLSVATRTIDYLIAKKELTARRIGRKVLIPYKEIEAFVRRDHASPSGQRKPSSFPSPRRVDQ